MLTDPQTVTVATVAQTLPRISSGALTSKYREDVGEFEFRVNHREGKRNSRMVELTQIKTTTDPYVPANNIQVRQKCYLVIDAPIAGFTPTEQLNLVEGLTAWLTSANIAKIVAGES